MLLYLVQHAEAKSKEEDPSRCLSEKGIHDIGKTTAFLVKLDIKVSQIFHSGKRRALQTAQVLADYLNIERGISETDGLAPMDDAGIWYKRISDMNEDVILVGHLPHLAKLSSLLLSDDMEKSIVDFKMGGIICLKRAEDGNWSVEWMIIPEVFK